MAIKMIVAGGPIRNRAWCVRDHVLALDAAAREADVDLRYCYVLGDSTDGTHDTLLSALRETRRKYYIIYRPDPDGIGHSRDGEHRYSLHNLAQARQQWVDVSILNSPSHLWSVDSDIIVHQSSLSQLLAAGCYMAGARVQLSELNPDIYNVMFQWDQSPIGPGQPYRGGNEHKFAGWVHPIPCTWTGACVLYRSEVFTELGCQYWNDDIAATNPLRMEELSIVRKLRDNNIRPWWVPAARTTHLMTAPT